MANYSAPTNDNISRAMEAVGIIPEELRGSDTFLDVVTWNIKYFHDRDPARVEAIAKILGVLNADILVLQEILDGSMDTVAAKLRESGAGHYVAAHGKSGGQQRVAMLWDLDWIRAKDDIRELFSEEPVLTPDQKDAFPRKPLLGHFSALGGNGVEAAFDFQLCGVHLKSQRGGGELQRRLASEWLAHWFRYDAAAVDTDIILAGDWNATVDSEAWDAFRELEKSGEALFEQINDKSEISHLYYKSKREIGSRLDLVAVSMASAARLVDEGSKVVRWAPLADLLEASPSAQEIKNYIKTVSGDRRGVGGISDHLPVITRFYFAKPAAVAKRRTARSAAAKTSRTRK